jgi:hypothetical protein
MWPELRDRSLNDTLGPSSIGDLTTLFHVPRVVRSRRPVIPEALTE